MLNKALKIRRAILPKGHADISRTLKVLAEVNAKLGWFNSSGRYFQSQGRAYYGEGLQLYKQLIENMRLILAENDPSLIVCYEYVLVPPPLEMLATCGLVGRWGCSFLSPPCHHSYGRLFFAPSQAFGWQHGDRGRANCGGGAEKGRGALPRSLGRAREVLRRHSRLHIGHRHVLH